MISTRDLENVVAQVNARFDEINNKVDKLEKEKKKHGDDYIPQKKTISKRG